MAAQPSGAETRSELSFRKTGGLALGALLTAGIWTGAGGGMTFALAVHPSRPGTVYAGTERGGVFESPNAGRSWRRLTRSQRRGRIKALAVDGAGTVYLSDADGRLLRSMETRESWSVVDGGAGSAEI